MMTIVNRYLLSFDIETVDELSTAFWGVQIQRKFQQSVNSRALFMCYFKNDKKIIA